MTDKMISINPHAGIYTGFGSVGHHWMLSAHLRPYRAKSYVLMRMVSSNLTLTIRELALDRQDGILLPDLEQGGQEGRHRPA